MQKKRYNLSSVQKNIWMLENFYKGTQINNLTGYVIFNEIIDYGAMVEALNYYLKQNEIVRGKIIETESDIYQEIQDFNEIKPEIYNFKDKSKEQIEEFINKYSEIPMNIKDKMFEFNVIYTNENKTIVLVKFHHLIADAWSFISLFMNEMVEYYYKIKNNIKIEDTKENCKYNILLEREKEYEGSNKYEIDKEFWHNEMKDLEGYSVMKSSNIKYSHNAKRIVRKVEKEDYKKITQFCKENKVTEYTIFLAALSIYLYRTQLYKKDVTLGTPILNRLTKEEKKAAGLFISTIPLRLNITDKDTFLEVCKKISSKMFNVFRHQRYPYSKIVEDVYRNSDIKKLYDVMISYQNAKFSDIVKEKGIVRVWPFQNYQQEQFVMHITNYENNETLEIFYDYLVDLFEEKEINFIHDRIINLILNGITTEKKVSKLPVVTEEEKDLILNVFNDTDEEYPQKDNIISIFEKQVKKHKNKIAVKYKDENITYENLSKKVNLLAKELIKEGVGKDEVVLVKVDRGINQIISMLAVLKAGGAYMPVHMQWPEDRVLYMIEDSKPKAIITQEKYMDMFTVVNECNFNILSNNTVIDVDSFFVNCDLTKEIKLDVEIMPEDFAYIIYTSGTTGRPKGTLITHRNVVRLLITENYPYDFRETDIWTMFHTYTFDFSVWEMYGALLYGGTLVIVPNEVTKDTQKYLELLKREKVTIQNQTPSYLYKVIENEMLNEDAKLCLRYIILGGEAFHPKKIKEFQNRYPDTKIVNGYGVTETTVFTTQKVVTNQEIEKDESNIGRQLPTRKVYILDNNLELMPLGVEGELCESGLGVCAGYLNNEELTKKKFIKNPYGNDLLYKTGDIAKLKFNGDIIYIGRNDNQVKIRGFRIEIEEIERLLLNINGIKKVIVFAHKENNENDLLYAFIVPEKNVVLDIVSIKNKLLEDIPLYMLPFIYIVSDIKTNINGKADKKSLLEYVKNVKKEKSKEAEKPTNKLEEIVLEVFKRLSLGSINGITDNFFENNVDSLQILKITLELSKKNINISPQDVYNAKDIKTLCENIQNNETNSDNKILEILEDEDYKNIDIISNKFNLNKVFLTGASGFLGIHILEELLLNKDVSKIYCLIREKNGMSALERLKSTYKKYFKENTLDKFNEKVVVLKGDFLKENLGISEKEYLLLSNEINTIINAAADVKHYGRYEDFYNSNVKSVENLLKLVDKSNASFAHISTESVGGYTKVENVSTYNENDFDIGQTFFDNVYIKTKFEAEKTIIKYKKINQEKNIKILRLGNIMPRLKDGIFQINANQNAFIQKIKGIIKLKYVPDILLESKIDISPVDICAKAVIKLIKNDENKSVYHVSNDNLKVKEIIELLNKLNLKIQICNIEEFKEKIMNLTEDYIAILQEQFNQLGYELNVIDNNSTKFILNDLDVSWPKIDKNYMKYIVKIIE